MTKEQEIRKKIKKTVNEITPSEIRERIEKDEQEEAIETLKKMKENIDKKYLKTRNSIAIETALNMLKEKNEEIEIHTKLEHIYKKDYLDTLNLLKKKEKQIDLMAELIARKPGSRIEICHNMQCDKKTAKECKICTKQYFKELAERKSENGN